MPRIETLGGIVFVVSASVFVASYLGIAQAKQYKTLAEYGAIAGAAVWILGKVV